MQNLDCFRAFIREKIDKSSKIIINVKTFVFPFFKKKNMKKLTPLFKVGAAHNLSRPCQIDDDGASAAVNWM